jgi:hypothetical protein
MDYARILLSAFCAFVAYFVYGGILFGLLPWLRTEFARYPAVYRPKEGIKSVMPFGMIAMFVALVAIAMLYAMIDRSVSGASGVAGGAQFGALIGVFAIGSFVIHNYVNLNIGLKLTIRQAIAYFVQWVIVGIVIGLIYKPAVH